MSRVKMMFSHRNEKNGEAAPLIAEDVYQIIMDVSLRRFPSGVGLFLCCLVGCGSCTAVAFAVCLLTTTHFISVIRLSLSLAAALGC
jgi:hypothetical protein